MRAPLLLAAALTLSGCIDMSAAECGGANWFDIGFRDGLAGMQRMDIAYDEHCGKYGARTDTATYAAGWQNGYWEYARRANWESAD
jgi:hypothetical protein